MEKAYNLLLLIVITSLCMLGGCSNPNLIPCNTNSVRIVVDPDEIHQNMDKQFASIFDSCRYVQLETRMESLLGNISKVIPHNNRLYILDKSITKSVFVFDIQGSWINTISRMGKGPGEYLEVTDIYIDPIDESLNLVCPANRKIMKFDQDGNNLIKEILIP